MKNHRFVIVGATGLVGRQILKLLSERQVPLPQIKALASEKSVGKPLSYGTGTLKIASLESFDFSDTQVALFCTDSALSRQYIPRATAAGCYVIDKSSAFRLDPKIPLIVPEVNGDRLINKPKHRIVANPNCMAIALAMVLGPLHKEIGIKRVVISTYQSVSGAGKEGMDELYNQTKTYFMNAPLEPKFFSKKIAFNILPQIDSLMASGYTGEEEKIIYELKKIVAADIKISVTGVRVPVFIGHSASVHIEFVGSYPRGTIPALLSRSPGLQVIDAKSELGYASPLEVVGEDSVYVSRIREDLSVKYGLALWLSCDNLRKGAALNGLQIADLILKYHI